MSRKTCLWSGMGLIVLSLIMEMSDTTIAFLAFIKYVSLAYGIVFAGIALFSFWKPRWHPHVWQDLAILILLCYTIMAMDTFFFHALTWFPGLVRYALFSTYLPFYLVFLLISLLFVWGRDEQCTDKRKTKAE